ncbi:hypothetical protein [Arthrobacter sp. 08Y14]|uniref:hypothetical protein n=1 Tax=Arthrobacter sp. 08Y14 TaxID=2058885 RepID=UPI000CE3D683|nr:hypothetical protein [Arthrobacter sp. 08Y14]
MSREQLGAVAGDESQPVPEKRLGWFGRLRSQPGFRTASVAFVLTVVLGIGSTVAYAYWGQRNTVTQLVTTERQALPAITGKPTCRQFASVGIVYIDYTKVDPVLLPSGAQILVTVSVRGREAKKSFVIENTGSFALRDLPGLDDFIGPSIDSKTIYVDVTTAYVEPLPQRLPEALSASMKIIDPAPSAGAVEARFRASYFC